MFDLGFQELVLIFIVALLVFGPKKLPEIGRTLGRGLGELRKAMTDVKDAVQSEENLIREQMPDFKKPIGDLLQSVKNAEDSVMGAGPRSQPSDSPTEKAKSDFTSDSPSKEDEVKQDDR